MSPDLFTELEQARATGVLRIAGKDLHEVPPHVRELQGLRELRLNDCEITELPEWLGELSSLESIDLGQNPIRRLPSTLGELSSLRLLALSGTPIAELDESLRELRSLEVLMIPSARLHALPRWIGDLTALRILDVSDNQIASLPPEIYELQALTHLHLWGNQIYDLPTPWLPLSALEVLDLSRVGIASIHANQPSVNTTLVPLFDPSVSVAFVAGRVGKEPYLRLGELPEWFARAFPSLRVLNLGGQQLRTLPARLPPRLEWLLLGGNSIESFPPAILAARQLRYLDISANGLRTLPDEIAPLGELSHLDLRQNDLQIPPEILKDPESPRTIIDYLTRAQGPTQRLDQAKLLVVGEGSVGKTSLIKRLETGDFSEHEQKTAGIDVSRWSLDVGDDPILLNVWDFGGQEIMHATHQFFLTKRSVYVLVVDARQGEDQNRIEYWLKLIQSFAETSPILIVANKTEQAPMDIDTRGLREKYPSIVAILPISCKTGEGIDAVKDALKSSLAQMPHVRDLLPAAFFSIKRELEQSDADYLPFDDYERLCREHGIDDLRGQESLVGFLHDLGTVLCFRDDPRLSDTNILNPDWVTGGVYRLLNSHLAAQRKGLLRWEDVDEILRSADYPSERRAFILDMMRRFELCFESDGIYLIPDLLTKQEPDTGSWDDALRFEVKYDVLPSSVISRLIVRMHRGISQETVWRTGLVLAIDGNRGLVKGDREDAVVRIAVTGPAGGRRGLLTAIRAELRAITAGIPGLSGEERVPVPGHLGVWVPYEHLLELEAAGRDFVVPQGLTEDYRISELLAGIESRSERSPKATAIISDTAASDHTAPVAEGPLWTPTQAIRLGWWLLGAFIASVLLFVGTDLLIGVEAAGVVGATSLGLIIVIAAIILRSSGRLSEAGFLTALRQARSEE